MLLNEKCAKLDHLEDETYNDEDDAAASNFVGGVVLLEVVRINCVAGSTDAVVIIRILLILTEKNDSTL